MSNEIPTSVEWLDLVAEVLAKREGNATPVSDYRVAKEMDVSRSMISAVRTGRATWGTDSNDPERLPTAYKIADILKLNPEFVVMCIQTERTQNVAMKAALQGAVKKLAVVALTLGFMTIFLPHEARADATWPVQPVDGRLIHYAHQRRRRTPWRLGLASRAVLLLQGVCDGFRVCTPQAAF